nr:PREDICTED: THAP domain-containing protein 1-like [Linepithema humile]
MSYCVVSGCKNRKYKKNSEFSKNNEKRQKWFEVLHFNNPSKWGAVCSAHFKEMDYDTNNMRRTLKANAVPFLSEEYSSKLIIHSEENVQSDGANNEQMKIAEVPLSETSNINSGKTHRSTSISPDRILNSPTKSRLRERHKREIATLKRNLAVTTYKQKKAEKNCLLQKILKELSKKNLITAEEVNILQDFNSAITGRNSTATREAAYNDWTSSASLVSSG